MMSSVFLSTPNVSLASPLAAYHCLRTLTNVVLDHLNSTIPHEKGKLTRTYEPSVVRSPEANVPQGAKEDPFLGKQPSKDS
jgi:hypothetical protein